MSILRPYQQKGIDDIRAAIASGSKSPIFVAPTGMGKSVLIGAIAHAAHQKGRRVIVVAHRQRIVRQNAAKIEAHGVKCGLVMAKEPMDATADIHSASVMTLTKREIEAPDILIVDENHLSLATSYQKLFDRWPNALRIGFTASPARLDGRGLGERWDSIVPGPTIKHLQSLGFLAPLRCYAPPMVADLGGVAIRGGEFASDQLMERLKKDGVVGDAIEHYKKLGGGKSAVAFCVTIEHAKETAEAFRAAGIASEHVDSTMGDEAVEDVLKRVEAGVCRVLCSVDLVACGTDIPRLKVAIMLRPTMSLVVFMQSTGRILRPWEGEEAIVLDHVGNIARHGMPTADRVWTLDAKEKGNKASEKALVGVFTCLSCYGQTVRPADVCACCGAEIPVKDRVIPMTAGELKEIKEAEIEAAKVAFKRERSACRTLPELVAFAVKQGYKSPKTWACYIMDAREQKKNEDVEWFGVRAPKLIKEWLLIPENKEKHKKNVDEKGKHKREIWKKNNFEKLKEIQRKRREKDPEKAKEMDRKKQNKWRKNNLEKAKEKERKQWEKRKTKQQTKSSAP